jgi:hypothetical protein
LKQVAFIDLMPSTPCLRLIASAFGMSGQYNSGMDSVVKLYARKHFTVIQGRRHLGHLESHPGITPERRTTMRARNMCIAFLAVMVLAAAAPAGAAEGNPFELRTGDTVKTILENRVGQPVTILLASGQEMSGVVTSVGDRMLHLSKLSGREFYDAAVSMDRIDGVILKVRGK